MAKNENIDIRLPTCYNQIKRGGCREQWDLFSFTGLPRPDTPKLNVAFTVARRPIKVCVLFAYLRKKDGGMVLCPNQQRHRTVPCLETRFLKY